MSYIHEALKKAQREKEYLASKCAAIWPQRSNSRRLFSRDRSISVCVVVAAVAFSVYTWVQSIDLLPLDQKSDSTIHRGAINAPSPLPSVKPPRPTTGDPGRNSKVSQPPATEVLKKTSSQSLLAGREKQTAPSEERALLDKIPPSGNGKTLYQDAVVRQKEGKFQEAVALYKAALKRSPNLVSALNNLGTIFIRQNNLTEARKVLEKAIRTDANYVDPYYNLACLHAQQKDIGRSLFYLKKAVSVDESARLWAKTDEDLKNLRGHVEYEKIIRGVHNS